VEDASAIVVANQVSFPSVCESLQVEAGVILESPDQKARDFVVQIVLPR
jgi:hypothetical protein